MTLLPHDRALLQAFRRGDRRALERTYRHYEPNVERYLRTFAFRLGAHELCQYGVLADLRQDVFVKAFQESSRQSYDGLRPFGPYLRRIAKNRFLDALRARRKETPLSRELPSPCEAPDEFGLPRAQDPRMLHVCRAYVAKLPRGLRAVYEQRFVLGRSQLEAARNLELTRAQLRTREGRLHQGLRKALAPWRLREPPPPARRVRCPPALRAP